MQLGPARTRHSNLSAEALSWLWSVEGNELKQVELKHTEMEVPEWN